MTSPGLAAILEPVAPATFIFALAFGFGRKSARNSSLSALTMKNPAFRKALCALLVGLGVGTFLPGSAAAKPLLTLLAGGGPDGSAVFLEDLTHLWNRMTQPIPEALTTAIVPEVGRRLRALGRNRAHFAIITTAQATHLLPEYRDLAAIGLLWPNYLHALTRDPAVSHVGLPVKGQVTVAAADRFVLDGLREMTLDGSGREEPPRLAENGALPAFLAGSGGEVFFFTAPVPVEEVSQALEREDGLRLLAFSSRFVEELRLLYPWLQTATLKRGTYPGMTRNLELPVRYQVMVARRDLAAPAVHKMLRALYRRSPAVAPFNPLFGTLNGKTNAAFAKLFPFHPVAAKELGFRQEGF